MHAWIRFIAAAVTAAVAAAALALPLSAAAIIARMSSEINQRIQRTPHPAY